MVFTIAKIVLMIVVYFACIHGALVQFKLEKSRREWKLIEGKILEVHLKDQPYKEGKKYVDSYLEYSYVIDGKSYRNREVLSLKEIFPETFSLAEIRKMKIKTYKLSATIPVWYNTANTNESTSKKEEGKYVYMLVFGILVEMVLLILLVRDFSNTQNA